MSDAATPLEAPPGRDDAPRLYDRRSLTYANTFEGAGTRGAIRAIEWATAKPAILRRLREFERRGAAGENHAGQAFWRACLNVMGIDLLTPPDEVARIPVAGPVVLVANHPHGLVDGMILADLVGRVRGDYRILTRSILTGIDESASSYMIPVPFPHEAGAQEGMLAMRRAAGAHLARGGLLALFPAGVVAASRTPWGPAVEAEWNVFTAKLIRTSGAAVLPVRFPGANSRAYQIANRLSPTLRQGLLLHEVVHAMDRPQAPVVGHPIPPADLAPRLGEPRSLMAWLRERTLAL
jgi:putative hemolysin